MKFGPNRETMQDAVDSGHADWIEDNAIQYNRYINMQYRLVHGPGTIIRLLPDESRLPVKGKEDDDNSNGKTSPDGDHESDTGMADDDVAADGDLPNAGVRGQDPVDDGDD